MAKKHPKFGKWNSTTQFPGICTIKVFDGGVVVKKQKEEPIEYPCENLKEAKETADNFRARVFSEGKDVKFFAL